MQNDPYIVEGYNTQLEFASCKSVPYIGFVGGRGSGKSTALAMWLYKWSLLERGLTGCMRRRFRF
jgi:hypothetical protein